MEVRDTTVALIGNTFLAQSISRSTNPRFLRTVELLRSADATIANMECAIPSPEDPPAFVAGQGWAATYMVGRPEMIDEFKFLGIDVACVANNHVSDFGDAGILSTIRHLKAARMAYAGIGSSITEANAPTYVDTPSGLRIAVIVACDWGPRGTLGVGFPWPAGYLPSDDGPPFHPRPGVNLLRYEAASRVTPAQLEQLRQISRDLGWEDDKIARRSGFKRSHPLVGMVTNIGVEEDTETELWFLGRKFVAGDGHGYHTVPCEEDLERICRQIRDARRQADIVCVGLHDQSHGDEVHDFISAFAHAAIDAGADLYFNNGGRLMGIEIYKKKAIIYGIPGFFLQTEAVSNVPSSEMARFGLPPDATAADFLDAREASKDRAFEASVGGKDRVADLVAPTIHQCVFDNDGRLKAIEIQPLSPLGGTILHTDTAVRVPRFRRGLPLMPDAADPLAERVKQHISQASAQFGTSVELRDGRVVVSLN